MQIPKDTRPLRLDETLAGEPVSAEQHAVFLALMDRDASVDEPLTPRSRPVVSHGEAPAFLPPSTSTAPLATVDHLHLRLTNGALAGMLVEAHQHAGKLTLRLRLGSTGQIARDDERLAVLKHELARQFGSSLPIEFSDHDALTD